MYCLLVRIRVKDGYVDRFREAMLGDAVGSVEKEPGCLRFDIIRAEDSQSTLYLYEVYRDKASYNRHQTTPHFTKWKNTTADWLASPVEVMQGESIFPDDEEWDGQKRARP